jgi:accessory gene regulator protein AgrB
MAWYSLHNFTIALLGIWIWQENKVPESCNIFKYNIKDLRIFPIVASRKCNNEQRDIFEYVVETIIIIIIMSLVTGLFFLAILLNQQW